MTDGPYMIDLGTFDVVVVGGGLVGLATGLGMVEMGGRIALFDADDNSLRASRGNFGLVWSQSKGNRSQEYATWTRSSIRDWPALNDDLRALTGIETHYRSGTGLHLCLKEDEFAKRERMVERIAAYNLPGDDTRMIGREELLEIMPMIGPDVVGASVSSLDGDCHSLNLYQGLGMAYRRAGGEMIGSAPVRAIEPKADGYVVKTDGHRARAPKVLLAAGLGSGALASRLGFPTILRPQKGQILVTERTEPFLPVTTSNIRQTPEGSVLIGDTKEDTGFDDRSSASGVASLARRAVRSVPFMGRLRIVRSWGALRILTLDGDPVYDESPVHPGVYVATTHSGVTLAPAHRGPLAQWILNGQKPLEFKAFSARRFETQPQVGGVVQ